MAPQGLGNFVLVTDFRGERNKNAMKFCVYLHTHLENM